MNGPSLSIVFLGLSLSSSWGNGHATTYRALLRALAERGHDVVFLERDVPWYAANADLLYPSFCRLDLYGDLDDLARRHRRLLSEADVVIVGSFVPQGCAVARLVLGWATGLVGFYDIDTPVTLAKLDARDEEYLSPALVPAFDFYLSFTGGPTLERLRRDYGARLPWPFYCMVDPSIYRPTGEPKRWDLGYLGTYSADRQPALERLLIATARRLPDRRFVVAGAQYPDSIDWPGNVELIEHVPPSAHASFYSRLRFALNLTRRNMLATGWSPSVRLFEAAACGAVILSDRWEGLDSFFPENEAIVVVEDADDVETALARLDPSTISSIAARAREIVLANHTGHDRARDLEMAFEAAGLSRPQKIRI